MKVGMNMLLWTTHVTPEDYPHLERIKGAGFDGVEIPLFEGDDAHFEALRKELDSQGLACTTVTVMPPGASAISEGPALRAAATEYLNKVVRHSAILGSETLCGPYYHPLGEFSGDGVTEDELARGADVHRRMATEAEKVNLKLALEYLNRFETYVLNTAADAAAYARRVGHPAFGTMYDTFHANIEEKDPIAAYTENAAHFHHFHVSENDRGTPGTGHVPWTETFRAVRASGYDGWLTIEAFGRALPDLAAATRVWRDFFPAREEVYVEGGRFIRRMWAEAGDGL